MSITVASNIAALRASNSLARTSEKLGTVFERLSSGLRINKASDDAAGLALSTALNTDVRLASVALRNANDGISIANLTDQALGQIGDVLTRMSELAEQSATGTFSNVQRSALQSEFLALGSEVERIAVTTKLNGLALLSGGQDVILQVGFNSFSTSQIQMRAVEGTLQSIQLAASGSSALSYSLIAGSVTDSQAAARTALDAVIAAISTISTKRGSVGAIESRLDSAVHLLQVTRENYSAAADRILSVDVAESAAELVRLQVLQQAGVAILAQANQQPQIVLSLLG